MSMNDDTPSDMPLDLAKKAAFRCNLMALLCGIWFLFTGWMWAFAMNEVISYPFAVLGLVMCLRGRKLAPASSLNRWAFGLLIVGFVISIGAIFIFK